MDSGLVQPWRVDANGQQWLKSVSMLQGVNADYGQHGVHGFVLVEEDEGGDQDDN
ncbi:hypothetical protein RISK_004939 [Rhodopirellula islandica]|uniref:Uncharacterized protein n=1 Tax=Rhodopirellula islandica TaxID=595434 RepID=A0A0J1EBQ1_RHOIS|nr:hypothetical protein [Rhodopirellula islandica]KLU02969.1 hypothetical protein RISK_004939 [Rhodopirellula islandica]